MKIEQCINDICERTGLSPENVKTTISQWATPLMQRGVVVKLELKRWRGLKSITEEELGIDKDDDWENIGEYLNLGTKSLLPKRINRRICSVENKARKNLIENSFDTLWGKFVPCTFYNRWKTNDDEIKKEYFELADSICSEFDVIVEEVVGCYMKYFKKLWMDNKINKAKWSNDYESYEKSSFEKIRSSMIGVQEFRKSFEYNSIFYFIPTPSEIELDILETEKVEGDREILSQQIEMKRTLAEEMNRLKEKNLEEFLNGTIGQIRKTISNIIKEVKENMILDPTNSFTTGNNRTKLLKMIDKVRELDFYDDVNIQNSLDKLQFDLKKDKDCRSQKEVEDTLFEIEAIIEKGYGDIVCSRYNLLEL